MKLKEESIVRYRTLFRICLALLSTVILVAACGRPATPVPQPTLAPSAALTSAPKDIVEPTRSVGVSPVQTPSGAGKEPGVVAPTPAPGVGVSPLEPGKGDTQEGALGLAKSDLAKRVNLTPEQISVVGVESVEWSDTSIGCPEPGKAYAQVITSGFKIVLRADGTTYTYHTGGGKVVLCQPGAAAPSAEKDVALAKTELAKKLNVPDSEIVVENVEEVEWRNTSLGCPEEGKMYLQVIVPGHVITLKAQGKTYEYHTGNNQAVTCERR
ncbi:MAG: hypothetical protein IT330_12085 [Anaerolineae bacterium]|nr:hypothetical protein [Anaerolineae bacterium]